jgi:hypothetical protein
MTQAERKAKIDSIRDLPGMIEGAVRGLNDKQLDTPYRQGGWTVRQVVHHLADSHMNAVTRMKLILTEDHPTLKPYDQDKWAALVDTQKAPIRSSLAIIRGLHERWIALLESVPEAAWSRTGFHPERGDVTLEGTLNTYAGHGEKHVQSILRLRAEKGW